MSDETREQYILRRMSEMENALAAARKANDESIRLFSYRGKGGGGYWIDPYGVKVANRAVRMGMQVDMNDVYERHMTRIAMRYRANPYDFRRPLWDVAKL